MVLDRMRYKVLLHPIPSYFGHLVFRFPLSVTSPY